MRRFIASYSIVLGLVLSQVDVARAAGDGDYVFSLTFSPVHLVRGPLLELTGEFESFHDFSLAVIGAVGFWSWESSTRVFEAGGQVRYYLIGSFDHGLQIGGEFLWSHIDLDDLHNTGVIGLMDAIEKYDPDKNCKFKTYAEFRIKGAILDQLRSLDWVPRSVRQKSRRLERAYGEVEQRLGRTASEDEVADSLGLQIDKFHELLNQVRGISLVNLEEIRGTNSDGDRAGTFADIVEDVHSENPFASLKLAETKNVIAETIATLPEKERLVVSLYYYEDLNMKEIGGILGITESRVCQIHTKAVLRLRAKLKSQIDR